MKTFLILILAAVSMAATAHAASTTYEASNPIAYQAGKVGDAKLCPQIQSAAVETKGTTLEATQLVLQEVNRSPLKIAPTGSSKSCLSDMICPTEDSFDIDSDTLISIMRNNDGGYPTTDLAGYSQLKITAITSPGKSMTCVYSLLSVR